MIFNGFYAACDSIRYVINIYRTSGAIIIKNEMRPINVFKRRFFIQRVRIMVMMAITHPNAHAVHSCVSKDFNGFEEAVV